MVSGTMDPVVFFDETKVPDPARGRVLLASGVVITVKVTDGAVSRARAVLAVWGPLPPDAVIRRALEAALASTPEPTKRQGRKPRPPRAPRVSAAQMRAAEREADRNKRLVESGETFAGRKPSGWRRK